MLWDPYIDYARKLASEAGEQATTVLRDIKLEALDAPGQLSMEVSARTFRYITDEEVAEQRKAAAAKKGRAKK